MLYNWNVIFSMLECFSLALKRFVKGVQNIYVWYIGEVMHPLNTISKVLNLKQNAFIIVIIIQMLFHVINYVLKTSVREDNSLITYALKWMHFEILDLNIMLSYTLWPNLYYYIFIFYINSTQLNSQWNIFLKRAKPEKSLECFPIDSLFNCYNYIVFVTKKQSRYCTTNYIKHFLHLSSNIVLSFLELLSLASSISS
jgi:hypothetical protein